jgi:hypothetical protein
MLNFSIVWQNLHGRNNLVESLVVNGNMMCDYLEIKEHIVNFYK